MLACLGMFFYLYLCSVVYQLSTAKLDHSKTEVTVMQPVHAPCLKITMILCHCLCCYPSACIQHHRADPPRDKRDTS